MRYPMTRATGQIVLVSATGFDLVLQPSPGLQPCEYWRHKLYFRLTAEADSVQSNPEYELFA
jgi:hypothetical protein